MFGTKVNEFDNSDGTIKSFNEIFPNTPLEGEGDVEILDIVDSNIFTSTVFNRDIEINGVVVQHDFGFNNFIDNQDFLEADNVRFKYLAKDLDEKVIARGFTFDELAEQLNVKVNIVKRRINVTVDNTMNPYHKFNVSRREM